MENLRTWLNGCRNYTSGVALYNQFGSDESLKRMFAEPESEFKKKRLEKALETLWDGRKDPDGLYNRPIQKHTAKRDKAPTADHVSLLRERLLENEQVIEDLQSEKEYLEEEMEDLSDELQQLKKQHGRSGWPVAMDATLTDLHARWKKTFLEQKDLQSRLYEVAKAGVKDKDREKEAGIMALRILELQDQISSFYERRDYYLDKGKLPAPLAPVAECLDPALYSKRYENAMTYRRTYRRKLDKLSPYDPKYKSVQDQLAKWQAEADKYRKLLKMD